MKVVVERHNLEATAVHKEQVKVEREKHNWIMLTVGGPTHSSGRRRCCEDRGGDNGSSLEVAPRCSSMKSESSYDLLSITGPDTCESPIIPWNPTATVRTRRHLVLRKRERHREDQQSDRKNASGRGGGGTIVTSKSSRSVLFLLVWLQLLSSSPGENGRWGGFMMASAQTVGVDICACQPSTYEFLLDFGLTCDNKTVDGPGINASECRVTTDRNLNVTDLVPITVSKIQVLELNQDLDVIATTPYEGEYTNGDIISFTSVIATDNITNADDVPRALQMTLEGRNSLEQDLVNYWIIIFDNSCGIYPVVLEGEQIGWTVFNGLSSPPVDLCPLAVTPTAAPVETIFPSASPSQSPASKAPATGPPETEAPSEPPAAPPSCPPVSTPTPHGSKKKPTYHHGSSAKHSGSSKGGSKKHNSARSKGKGGKGKGGGGSKRSSKLHQKSSKESPSKGKGKGSSGSNKSSAKSGKGKGGSPSSKSGKGNGGLPSSSKSGNGKGSPSSKGKGSSPFSKSNKGSASAKKKTDNYYHRNMKKLSSWGKMESRASALSSSWTGGGGTASLLKVHSPTVPVCPEPPSPVMKKTPRPIHRPSGGKGKGGDSSKSKMSKIMSKSKINAPPGKGKGSSPKSSSKSSGGKGSVKGSGKGGKGGGSSGSYEGDDVYEINDSGDGDAKVHEDSDQSDEERDGRAENDPSPPGPTPPSPAVGGSLFGGFSSATGRDGGGTKITFPPRPTPGPRPPAGNVFDKVDPLV